MEVTSFREVCHCSVLTISNWPTIVFKTIKKCVSKISNMWAETYCEDTLLPSSAIQAQAASLTA